MEPDFFSENQMTRPLTVTRHILEGRLILLEIWHISHNSETFNGTSYSEMLKFDISDLP